MTKYELIDDAKRCTSAECKCKGCSFYLTDNCVDRLIEEMVKIIEKSDDKD